MSRIRIRHSTGFRYAGDVSTSYNEARMLPVVNGGQFVIFSHLDVTPNTSALSYVDYWGTKVTAFEVLTPHSELSLTASSLVEVGVRPTAGVEHLSWGELEGARERRIETVEQLVQTRLTAPHEDVRELGERAREANASPGEAAMSILKDVHDAVDYEGGVTGVRTTAHEAWEVRRGVCQDISHIALGALRAAGIPALYVSGYLHPRPSAAIGETVSGESHAWVEYWDGEWRGWDPTNDIPIGERHVLVGRGRDYNDVPPLRGVFAGSSTSQLFVKVDITREA